MSWYHLVFSIQIYPRYVKKEENNILKTYQKQLRNLTRNTMLPLQPYDLLKYQLNKDEMDLSKKGLDFSILPRF